MEPNIRYAAAQAQKIQSDGYKPDIIVGIARGGLVPSRILADLLETRDFAIITIEYYVGIGQKSKDPVLKQCLHTQLPDKKVLLVDDVSDGGRSLQLAKKHLARTRRKRNQNSYHVLQTRNHNHA